MKKLLNRKLVAFAIAGIALATIILWNRSTRLVSYPEPSNNESKSDNSGSTPFGALYKDKPEKTREQSVGVTKSETAEEVFMIFPAPVTRSRASVMDLDHQVTALMTFKGTFEEFDINRDRITMTFDDVWPERNLKVFYGEGLPKEEAAYAGSVWAIKSGQGIEWYNRAFRIYIGDIKVNPLRPDIFPAEMLKFNHVWLVRTIGMTGSLSSREIYINSTYILYPENLVAFNEIVSKFEEVEGSTVQTIEDYAVVINLNKTEKPK